MLIEIYNRDRKSSALLWISKEQILAVETVDEEFCKVVIDRNAKYLVKLADLKFQSKVHHLFS